MTSRLSPGSSLKKLGLLFAIALGFGGFARAAEPFTSWTGGGASPKWGDTNNWSSVLTAAAPPYGTLTFTNGGTQGTTMTNDSITSMHSLFWGGASSWSLNQGGTTVLSLFDFSGAQPKVENDSTSLVTINAPVTYASNNGTPPNPYGELNAVNADITFGSSGTLTVNGSSVNGIRLFGSGHTINFNNTVSASGKYFAHATSGTGAIINMNGSFTAANFEVLNDGMLNLNNGGSLTGSIRLGGDNQGAGVTVVATKSGTFNLTASGGGQTFSGVINSVSGNTSGTLAVNSQASSGVNTLSGHIALDSNLRINQVNAGTLNITQAKGADNTTGTDIKGNTLALAATNSIVHSGTIYNSTGNGNVVITGTGSVALSGTNAYGGTTTLGTAVTLDINSSTALGTSTLMISGNGNLDNTSGAPLTLANNNNITLSNGSPTFVGASDGTHDLNLGTGILTLSNANRSITVSAGTLTFGGTINEIGTPKKLSKAGAGTLVLNGAAGNWTGGSEIDAGTLSIGSDSALGTGGLSLHGGTLQSSGGARTLANRVTIDVSSTIGGSAPITFNGGVTNISLSHTLTINNSATTTIATNLYLLDSETASKTVTIAGTGNLNVSGSISNNNAGNTVPVNLTMSGSGTLTLSGANNYSGNTTVSGGILQVANTSGSATGSGAVSVNNSTLASGATGSIGGAVTTSGSAPHIKPGGAGSIGTLNLAGGLTVGGTSPSIDFDLSGTSQTAGSGVNDEVVVTGAVTMNSAATINATLSATPTSGTVTYTLMTYGSKGGANGFVVGTITPTPTTATLTDSGTSLTLTLTYPSFSAFTITAATNNPTAGVGDQLTITAVDSTGATFTGVNGDIPLTFSGLLTTRGVPTIGNKTGSPINQGNSTTLTFVNGVASTSSGAGVLTAFTAGSQTLHVTDGSHSDSSPGGSASILNVVAGAASAADVETVADGSGLVVGGQSVTSGSSITVYAITRDAFSNFVANASATWSLTNNTGGVTNGDLVASGGSATFTGHRVGSAQIQAIVGSLTGQSGVQTVVAGAATQLTVETAANGGGVVVPAENIPSGTSTNVFAITRDANSNFVGNVAATWSLQNITGNVVAGDLVPAGDNKSAAFNGNLIGSADIQAVGPFTGQSGTITVTAPLTASDNACNYTGGGDFTGVNGGTNFQAWFDRSVGSGGGGFFRGTSANNGGSGADNIDTSCSGSFAWGMFSGGTTLLTDSAHVWRPFVGKLQPGQSFTIDMDNGFINTGGVVGFALQNAAQQDLFKFSFTGGQSTYQINNTDLSPAIAFTGDGLRVTFTLTSASNFTATVATPNTSIPTNYTGSLISQTDQTVSQVVFFTDGAGSGSLFDLFFNSMAIGNPTLALSPSTGTLTNGTYGAAFSQTIAVGGGVGPYTFAVTSGSLPDGFSLNPTNGVLSGTPTATNTYNFTVTVTDVYGYTGSAAYSFTVNPLAVSLTGTRAYDGTTNADASILSIANVVGADTVNVASGTAGLADKNAGTQAITSFDALVLGNNSAGNYTLIGATGAVVITQAVTSVTLSSSENPSGYKDSVNFMASLPADATGDVIFKTNGVVLSTNSVSAGIVTSDATALLPRGTSIITAEYAGDTNYLGSTNDLVGGQVVTNHPPVAATMTVHRTAGLTLKVAFADLATNWSDVDGDAVSLASLNLVTTNGINLSTNSSWILYTNGPNVNDQFNYSVSDGHGGTAFGLVNILILTNVTGQATGSIAISNGMVNLSFAGIPGATYNVQRSTNLNDWLTIWTTNAPDNGLFNFTDSFSDLGAPPPAAFYRLSWSP